MTRTANLRRTLPPATGTWAPLALFLLLGTVVAANLETAPSIPQVPNGAAAATGAAAVTQSATLYFPYYEERPGEWFGFAVTNNSDTDASLTFTAYSQNGNAMSLPTNPSTVQLGARRQMAKLGRELFGSYPSGVGWVELKCDTPFVSASYQYGRDDLKALDGGTAFTHAHSKLNFTRIYEGKGAFFGRDATTYLSLVNAGDGGLEVDLTLAGKGAVTVKVPIKGMLHKSISELFGPTQMDGSFVLVEPRSVVTGRMVGYASIKLEGVRLGLNAHPPGDLNDVMFIPQAAMGGGYFTNLKLLNTDTTSSRKVLMKAYSPAGELLAEADRTLDPLSSHELDAALLFGIAPQASPVSASVVIAPDGPGIVADAIIGDERGKKFAAAVPAEREAMQTGMFSQVANGAGWWTGLALHNVNAGPAEARIEVRDAAGRLVSSGKRVLKGLERLSNLLAELLPSSAGVVGGYVSLASDKPVIMQQLLGDTSLEALSAVPRTPIASPLDLSGSMIVTVDPMSDENPFRVVHQYRHAGGDTRFGVLQHAWSSVPDQSWTVPLSTIWAGSSSLNYQSSVKTGIGDLDNDGVLEVVTVEPNTAVRFFRHGSLGLPHYTTQLEPAARWDQADIKISVGDIDNDGQDELLLRQVTLMEAYRWQDGGLKRFWVKLVGGGTELGMGDPDNDGMNEVIVPVVDNGVHVFETSGEPSSWKPNVLSLPVTATPPLATTATVVKVVDLDPALRNGNEILVGGTFRRLLVGRFENGGCRWIYISDQFDDWTNSAASGDVDGDGTAEILVVDNAGVLKVFEPDAGSWRAGLAIPLGYWPAYDSVRAIDINRDGIDEIMIGSAGRTVSRPVPVQLYDLRDGVLRPIGVLLSVGSIRGLCVR